MAFVELEDSLIDFDDAVEDVQRSLYDTIQGALHRFILLLDQNPFFSNICQELPVVNFSEWHKCAKGTIRSMAGSGTLDWPIEKGDRIAMQLALIGYLAEGKEQVWSFAHDFMNAGLNHNDNVASFVEQVFEPFARDFRRSIERKTRTMIEKQPESEDKLQSKLQVFISHSNKDADIVKPLIDLIRSSLNIPASDIRATSIDGYRLPGGADTDEQLRAEVHTARSLVGIISNTSVESMYVMFELGARWGAKKHLIPLLAPDTPSSLLKGPLAGINALSIGNEDQLHQFVIDLGRELEQQVQSPAVYRTSIEAIIQAGKSRKVEAEAKPSSEDGIDGSLDEPQEKIMKLAATSQDNGLHVQDVMANLSISEQAAKYHLDELVRTHEYLRWVGNTNRDIPNRYPLTHKGRGFLIKRGLI